MNRQVLVRFASVSFLFFAEPALAANFFEKPLGDLGDELGRGWETLREGGEKLVKEIGNGAGAVTNEVANIAKHLSEQVERGVDDLKVLILTGRCNGDLCTALDAMVTYTRATLKAQVLSAQQAMERLEEGKIVDAVWHLGADPLNAQQEAAAQAAIRSSVIRAVGQAAATAYGGGAPGAAGYSAWLAYHETGGNLEYALRAGAIAGATSLVMQRTGTLTEGADIEAHLDVDQVARRAIISGAVAGVAVAVSGGDQAAIEKAAVAGLAMSVLRDGYKRLTLKDMTEDALKNSIGDGPCLAAGPSSDLPCVQEAKANGAVYEENGRLHVDYTKLSQRMPHVGTISDGSVPRNGFISDVLNWAVVEEDSSAMVFLSRIPGMNAMGHAHDAWVQSLVGSVDDATLKVITVASIPPFMVMTSSASGFGVQDLIRKETAARAAGTTPRVAPTVHNPVPVDPANSPDLSAPAMPVAEYTTVPGLPIEAGEQPAAEIRQLVCVKDRDSRSTVLELPLNNPNTNVAETRICSVDRLTDTGVIHFWHAHHQATSCITKFNEIALRNLRNGWECAVSIGVRYGVARASVDLR